MVSSGGGRIGSVPADHLAPGGMAHDPVIAPPHRGAKTGPDVATQ
jgi:hypothetical protein